MTLLSSFASQKSILRSFSLIANIKSFIKIREDESLSYLRGIKAFSYISVIFLHVLLFSYYFPSRNSKDLYDIQEGFAKNTMVASFSGLSVCYTIGSLLATKAIVKLLKMWEMFNYLLKLTKIILARNSTSQCCIFIDASVSFLHSSSSFVSRNLSSITGFLNSSTHPSSTLVKWKRSAPIYGCPWHFCKIICTALQRGSVCFYSCS